MNIGKACAIFEQTDSDKFTAEEKAEAIYRVMQMPTHNGVTKDRCFAVIKYLFDMLYEVGGT